MSGTAPQRIALLEAGLRELSERDPQIAQAVAEAGPPVFELRPAGFPTLMRAIVAQQVSAASARAIYGRLEEAVQPLTAERLQTLGPEILRECGFSRPKIKYAFALAERVSDGRLPLAILDDLSDQQIMEALTAVPGIGPWSAEVYMIFAMGRPDVWPAADLALQTAQQKLYELDERPKPKRSRELAEVWAPYRSVAATLLWHYYRTMP